MKSATLRGRLALGWDPEDAITRRKNEEPPLLFTHFDRALTFRGWAEQSGIAYRTLYTRVFTNGMKFRDALLQGPDDPGFAVPFTVFGETKPLHRWALDPRTNCTAATLHRRFEANWPLEAAVTEKPPPATGTRPEDVRHPAPEPLTLRITAGHLQPGDNVLAIDQDPVTGTPVLTVRRPPPPATGPGRTVPVPRTQAQGVVPLPGSPPRSATPRAGAPNR
ncbi:hypothetical protein [Streptomyces sp. NPDC058280]|uniref:hypothetical protein n=1 Tax=Streptomyces sp. NPDC058280 TaxID=3346419 RepID=UPI0036ECA5EF